MAVDPLQTLTQIATPPPPAPERPPAPAEQPRPAQPTARVEAPRSEPPRPAPVDEVTLSAPRTEPQPGPRAQPAPRPAGNQAQRQQVDILG